MCGTARVKFTYVISKATSHITPVHEMVSQETGDHPNCLDLPKYREHILNVDFALICIRSSVCFYMYVCECVCILYNILLYILFPLGR